MMKRTERIEEIKLELVRDGELPMEVFLGDEVPSDEWDDFDWEVAHTMYNVFNMDGSNITIDNIAYDFVMEYKYIDANTGVFTYIDGGRVIFNRLYYKMYDILGICDEGDIIGYIDLPIDILTEDLTYL